MVALQYTGLKKDPAFISKEASIADIPAVTEFAEIELEKLGCP